jgi:hypothetical protein
MEKEIDLIVEKGKNLKLKIGKMVSSYDYPRDKKNLILIAYHSLIAEHHTSIHLLIQNKLYGSSFSLVRALYEPLYRAHWVYGCATMDQINRIVAGKNVFPKMKDMVEEIDRAYDTGGFWQMIKDNSWSAMNDYTHSGVRQIGCRFKDNEVAPYYELDAIIEVLNGTNMALLLMALFFFHALGKTKETKEIEKMIIDYSSEVTGSEEA